MRKRARSPRSGAAEKRHGSDLGRRAGPHRRDIGQVPPRPPRLLWFLALSLLRPVYPVDRNSAETYHRAMTNTRPLRVYVGTGTEQLLPFHVLAYTIRRCASAPVDVMPLNEA